MVAVGRDRVLGRVMHLVGMDCISDSAGGNRRLAAADRPPDLDCDPRPERVGAAAEPGRGPLEPGVHGMVRRPAQADIILSPLAGWMTVHDIGDHLEWTIGTSLLSDKISKTTDAVRAERRRSRAGRDELGGDHDRCGRYLVAPHQIWSRHTNAWDIADVGHDGADETARLITRRLTPRPHRCGIGDESPKLWTV